MQGGWQPPPGGGGYGQPPGQPPAQQPDSFAQTAVGPSQGTPGFGQATAPSAQPAYGQAPPTQQAGFGAPPSPYGAPPPQQQYGAPQAQAPYGGAQQGYPQPQAMGYPGAQGYGQYEFNDFENSIVAKTAGRARLWGIISIVIGSLYTLSGFFFFLSPSTL